MEQCRLARAGNLQIRVLPPPFVKPVSFVETFRVGGGGVVNFTSQMSILMNNYEFFLLMASRQYADRSGAMPSTV